MGKILPILGIFVIIGIFWFVAYDDSELDKTINRADSEAKKIIHEFGDTGEQIIFFGDPQAPLTEFIYVEKDVTKQVYNNSTKQYENVTTTELEKIPTSEVGITSLDLQRGDTKVCKRGNQCKITGEITLIDPNTKLEIAPPYGFFLQVSCESSNDPVMNCNNFTPRIQNIITHADKSFDYTFTTDRNDPTGFYTVLVSVASKYKSLNPETQLEEYVRRDGTLRLELIP